MRIIKSHPLLKLVNAYVIDHSQPTNINYLWNFGSLLALCLGIQIITGVTLAMHYNPSVAEAFNSVEHIMRDVNNGWLIRYLHSNTASAFFFLVYLHIGRGFYYGSYRAPRTLAWVLGVVILILMIGTGFLGYLNIAQNDYNIIKPYKINFNKRYYSTLSNSQRIFNFLNSKNLNPVFLYDNLNLEETRKKISKETKNLSGIYMILNKESLNYYIGSASTGRFNSRFTNHLLYFNGSKVLKNSVKKYGLHNFAFIILELYPEIVNQENNKQLLNLEDFYLKSLLPNYNILTEAGSSFGYKHTEITRIKMKANYSEARRKNIKDLNKNTNLSSEIKSTLSESSLNRDKINYTKEGILNMKKSSKPLIVKELNGIVFGDFPSIIDTAKALNCSYKTIYRALRSPSKKLKGRWIVNYKN